MIFGLVTCTLAYSHGVKVPCNGDVLLKVKQSKVKISKLFFILASACRTVGDFKQRLRR